MTTIIALRGVDAVLMAGDGLSYKDDEIVKLNQKKIFNIEDQFLIGFAGADCLIELFRKRFKKRIEILKCSDTVFDLDFVFETANYLLFNDEDIIRLIDREFLLDMLVADFQNIYKISLNSGLTICNDNVGAIGSGSAYAYGGLDLESSFIKEKNLLELECTAVRIMEATIGRHLYSGGLISMERLKKPNVVR